MLIRSLILPLFFLFFFSGCSQQETGEVTENTDSLKIEDEIFYLIVPASFYDSDGNSMGDLRGVVKKLDYIQSLGVTSIILTPLYPSPYYHNYFADDFVGIDEDYGTMEDYLSMIREIHNRGMKFYLDTEFQYVTENHDWYSQSLNNPLSEYSDYILYDDSLNKQPATIIFGVRGLYSYTNEFTHIATVNLKNKKVKEYLTEQFKFWTDPNGDGEFSDGVDGFRIDHMMDNLDGKEQLTHLFQEFWEPLISEIRHVNPDIRFIAEQADWGDPGGSYFKDADIDIAYAFGLLFSLRDPVKLTESVNSMNESKGEENFHFLFLSNHDIDRFASLVDGDSEAIKLFAAMLYLQDGLPFIYYGQEIGMEGKFLDLSPFDEIGKPNDGDMIPRREAMDWYSDLDGEGVALWYKDTGPWWDSTYTIANDGISVEEQEKDPGSLLNFYRRLLNLRKSNPVLSSGEQKVLSVIEGTGIFAFTRYLEGNNFLLVFNTTDQPASVRYNLKETGISNMEWSVSLQQKGSYQTTEDYIDFQLGAYGFMVLNGN